MSEVSTLILGSLVVQQFTATTEPISFTPQRCTRRQGRLALLQAGHVGAARRHTGAA